MTYAVLQDTVNRQAKRLREQFNIDLTFAKQVLATGPYGCASWDDLCARLEEGLPSDGPLQMAALPESPSALAYLAKNLCVIARSISQHILTNRNLAGLCEALRLVFAVPGESIALADMLPNLRHSGWQPARIGPDPYAVIQSRSQVNGIELLLIGTRIYWPELFVFDSKIEADPKMAEPTGSGLRIMWQVAPWLQAARDYLFEYQREDNLEDDLDLVEPEITEDEAMLRHSRWFSECLCQWSQESHYNSEGEEFIPYLFQGQAYLIFGVPRSALSEPAALRSQRIKLPEGDDNRWQVVLLDHQPVCLEWLAPAPTGKARRDWLYLEYHQDICNGLLRHPESARWATSAAGHRHGLLFVNPACQFSLRHQMKVDIEPEPQEVLFTLRTDVPELAVEVLDRIAARDFVRYAHDLFETRYAMQFDVTDGEDCHGLNLSLDLVEMGIVSRISLITSFWFQQESRCILLLEIRPELINLVACHSLKMLKKSVLEGRVLRTKELDLHSRLDSLPVEMEGVGEGVAWPEISLNSEVFDFDVFHGAHFVRIRYSRDNF